MRLALPFSLFTLALALRAYRLAEYTVFQGDQGLDALAARRLVVAGVWPLEGPATSAGGVHLGPLYYYLLALPMLAGGFDPLLQAALMVVLGALAVVVLYGLARTWFGVLPAALAAALYAVSPAAIVASRSAWNPAPGPLFLLLALYGLARAHRCRQPRWLLLSGFGLGCLIQFHYFTLGVVAVCTVAAVWEARRGGWPWLAASAAVFAALLAPFALHEVLSGLPDLKAATSLAASAQPSSPQDSLPRRLYAVLALGLVGGFLANAIEPLAALLTLALLAALAMRRSYAHVLLGALLGATLLQAVLYRGPIFEHYFVPLAPLLYLLLAAAAATIAPRLALALGVALVVLNLANVPLRDPPGQHLARTAAVASAIQRQAGNEPFALWLMSPNDSDYAYRYQLARLGLAPDADATAHLFVVCQDQPCTPPGAPTWQTTLFDITLLEIRSSSDT